MSEEESGGVQGLRAWVLAATKRALRLYPHTGFAAAAPDAYDSSVAELGQLVRLLDHDAELRATASVQLGSVLTMRHLAGGGAPGDREQAQGLLREARDRGTAIGAVTDAEDRRWAAFFLMSLMAPSPHLGAGNGQAPDLPDLSDLSALFDWKARQDSEGRATTAAEMRELLAEIRELPLPPEQHQRLQQLSAMIAVLDRPDSPVDALRQFVDSMPEGFPYGDQMRMMADLTAAMSGAAAGPKPAANAEAPANPDPAARPEPSGSRWGQAPASPPASDDAQADAEVRNIAIIAVNALHSAAFGALEAAQSGDPEVLNRALGQLRAAHEQLPPGHEMTPFVEGLIGELLQAGQDVGGNLQDQALGRTYTKAFSDQLGLLGADSTSPLPGNLSLIGRVYPLSERLFVAQEAEDTAEVRAILTELVAIEADTPQDDRFRSHVLLALANACMILGILTNDDDMMLRSAAYQEQAAAVAEYAPASAQELLAEAPVRAAAWRAALTGDPTLIQDHTPAPPGASTGQLWTSAQYLIMRYGLTGEPAEFDAVVAELERVCEGVRQGQEPQLAANALWKMAEAYRGRWHNTQDPADQAAAAATAMEALNALAADVVLQLGSEHGLLAARAGAARAVTAATWAASNNQAEEAVAALELGRALVLQAASASRAVPELLEERGHHELAQAWRVSGAAQAPADEGPPGELPSTLRRRALEALGYRQQGLFTTPTLDDLADGVAEAGADALVYLLPGEGEAPGVGIIVGPDIGVGVGGLPLLSGTGSGPLEHYLDAAAERSRHLGEPAAEQAWEEALSALCDWAYPAALEAVFTVVAEHLAANDARHQSRSGPLRIVLIPCGRLGVVPWHAARLPEWALYDYACQFAVISYAASGSQFLRTVRRARRDPAAAPVLVADPRQELTRAEQEATALYEAFYPRARLYGEFYEPPVEPEATGTPDELLALLGESPSLLHVASHGSAGVRPTVSALHLAFPDGTDTLPAEEGGPGAAPDLGMLTVTRLLDRPADEQPAADGPLVVLSACETDLSTRDHDEALTLTTAFVSRGARDVVGSRWTTEDGASALMMAVFHHYLAVEGRSPVDALRAAQLWMLDPDRENPGSLSGELLREMGRPGLERLPVWAAFIHQGHPGLAQQAASAKGTA